MTFRAAREPTGERARSAENARAFVAGTVLVRCKRGWHDSTVDTPSTNPRATVDAELRAAASDDESALEEALAEFDVPPKTSPAKG